MKKEKGKRKKMTMRKNQRSKKVIIPSLTVKEKPPQNYMARIFQKAMKGPVSLNQIWLKMQNPCFKTKMKH